MHGSFGHTYSHKEPSTKKCLSWALAGGTRGAEAGRLRREELLAARLSRPHGTRGSSSAMPPSSNSSMACSSWALTGTLFLTVWFLLGVWLVPYTRQTTPPRFYSNLGTGPLRPSSGYFLRSTYPHGLLVLPDFVVTVCRAVHSASSCSNPKGSGNGNSTVARSIAITSVSCSSNLR